MGYFLLVFTCVSVDIDALQRKLDELDEEENEEENLAEEEVSAKDEFPIIDAERKTAETN